MAKLVKNADPGNGFDALRKLHHVDWRWVMGHAGDLATSALMGTTEARGSRCDESPCCATHRARRAREQGRPR